MTPPPLGFDHRRPDGVGTGRERHTAGLVAAWGLFAAILSAPTSVSGQATASAPGAFNTLTFTLTAPDRLFLPLEPVPLTMMIQNGTGKPVSGHTALEFATRYVTLMVQPQGSAAYEVSELSRSGGSVEFISDVVRPGARREVTDVLNYRLNKILPKPGRYAVWAVLHAHNAPDTVESTVAWIDVREPDIVEREALTFIEDTWAGAEYFFTLLAPLDLRRQLEEVATRFAGTPYADYANWCLGDYSASNGNTRDARLYLSRVAGKPDFPLADRAARRLAQLP